MIPLSLNCQPSFQELALAFHFGKPVVALVLDQEAWDLLTVPEGASLAKAAADAAQDHQSVAASSDNTGRRFSRQTSAEAAWMSDKHTDVSLVRFCGEEITPGQPMSLAVVGDLFARLSSINLCPCRQLEVDNQGWNSMLATAQRYVQKDLAYFKEHAELLALEGRWRRAGRSKGKLLGKKDAVWWREWCSRAVADRNEPQPTLEMKEFVRASSSAVSRRRTVFTVLAIIIAVMILSAAVASGVLAVKSNTQAERAEKEAGRARLAESIARAETERALHATIDAVSLLSLSNVRQDALSVPALWEVKVVNAVLDRLYGRGSAVADVLGMNAARHFARLGVPLMSVTDDRKLNTAFDSTNRWFRAMWSNDDTRLALTGFASESVMVASIGQEDVLGGRATQVLEGHDDWIWALAWSPDGTRLASGSRDGTLRVWEIDENGNVDAASVRVLEGHTKWVWTLAWSQDGTRLASGSNDYTVRLWSMDGGETSELAGHTKAVLTVAWSRCGSLLASGSADGTVRIWRVSPDINNGVAPPSSIYGGSPQVLKGHEGSEVWTLAWCPSGSLLAGLTGAQTLMVWPVVADGTVEEAKLQTVEQPSMFRSDTRSEFVLSWAPNGVFLASASDDECVQLWMVAPDGSVELRHQLNGGAPFIALSWAPTGHKLTATDEDGKRYGWGICPTRRLPLAVDEWLHEHTPRVASSAWNPTGNLIASASDSHSINAGGADYTTSVIRLFRVNQADGSINPPGAVQILRPQSGVSSTVWNSLAWSPDGNRLAAVGDPLGLWIWPVQDDGTVDITRCERLHIASGVAQHENNISYADVAWSANGRHIAAGTARGSSNDGDAIVFGVAVWSSVSAAADETSSQPSSALGDEPARVLTGHSGLVTALAFSPDSSRLASGSADGIVRLWQLSALDRGNSDGAAALVFHGHGSIGAVAALAWATTGRVLASCSAASDAESTVLLWDATSGAILQTLVASPTENDIMTSWSSLSFSPTGRSLAAGGDAGAIAVWPVVDDTDVNSYIDEEGVQRRTHPNARESVSVEWAPNGRYLATSAGLIAALLWPVQESVPTTAQALFVSEYPHSVLSDETTWDYLLGADFGCDFSALGHAGLQELCELEEMVEQVLEGEHTHWAVAASWAPSGRHLVSGSRDGTLRLWHASQSGALGVNTDAVPQVVPVDSRGVSSLDWSSGGSHLAAGGVDGAIRVWSMTVDANSVDIDSVKVLEGHDGEVLSLAWHPTEELLASGGRDSSIRLWRLGAQGWDAAIVLDEHSLFVTSLSWSPSGNHLASGSWDDSLRVWPVGVDAGAAVQSVAMGGDMGDTAVAWSPSGGHLAAARGLFLKLWPVSEGGVLEEEGVQVLEQRSVRVRTLAWAPGGGQLAGGTDGGEVWVWHMDTKTLRLLPHHRQRLEGHTQAVVGLGWSMGGSHLASASRDRSVRVWAMGLYELKRIFGKAYGGLNLTLTEEDFSMNPIPQALAAL